MPFGASISSRLLDGSFIGVLPTDYYGNPVDDQGLLVTTNLGAKKLHSEFTRNWDDN